MRTGRVFPISSNLAAWQPAIMPKKILVAVAIFAIAFSAIACKRPNTAADLASNVVDIASEALLKDDGGPKWDELDRRLDALFANNTKEGDEAIVILTSFYLGEHEGEEVEENLLRRGPRMIPLIERYLGEEPSSLLNEYPKRARLERTTTVGFLKEDLEILRVQAGAHRMWTTAIAKEIGEFGVMDIRTPDSLYGNNTPNSMIPFSRQNSLRL